MCDNCFITEINSFPDNASWLKFDLDLTKKLGLGKLKYIKFIQDGRFDKDDGKYIYHCLICDDRWKLKEPSGSFRGYLRQLSRFEKFSINLTVKQKGTLRISIIALIIILGLIYWILLK